MILNHIVEVLAYSQLLGKDICDQFFFFFLLGPHLWHTKVPRLEVTLELQLPAYTTARPDPSCVCKLYHNSLQRRIFNPLSDARDRTRVLVDASWVPYHWATRRTPNSNINRLLSRLSKLLISVQAGKNTGPWQTSVTGLFFCFFKICFLPFLGLLPWHMEVPRLGVESGL